ncbi:MAG: M48 family metallopeptidase [Chlorobi bacterium]|nr:M48 family metallopeptidase [Chlorobiota bacterium]
MFKGQLIKAGSSERTTVFVTVEKGVLKLSNGENHSVEAVSVEDRTGANSPFIIHLPTKEQLIITENVKEFGKEFYKHLPVYKRNWLHRFETWGKSLVVSIIVLIAAIAFWLTKGSDIVAGWITNRISYDLEYELGKSIIAGFKSLGWHIMEPTNYKEQRLEERFYVLANQAGIENAHLYIVHNFDMPNAFAVPGGFIVFTSKMVEDYMSQEDGLEALSGVVAHELGHIKHRHSLKALIRSALIASIFTMLTGDVSVVSLGMAQQMLNLAYSREQEEEADAYAIELIIKSDIDPDPFFQLMQELKEKYDIDEIPEFLRSHPHMSERINKMRELMKKYEEQY